VVRDVWRFHRALPGGGERGQGRGAGPGAQPERTGQTNWALPTNNTKKKLRRSVGIRPLFSWDWAGSQKELQVDGWQAGQHPQRNAGQKGVAGKRERGGGVRMVNGGDKKNRS